MDAQKLYEMMKKVQEPKGYYFNLDKERTFDLLEALILNKERYGYMGCPCRLLSGDRKNDRDIICPCDYSVPDIAEYGSCYCNLMFPRNGTRVKSNMNMFRRGGHRKKWVFNHAL